MKSELKSPETDQVVLMIIIAGRKQKNALLTSLLASGIHLIDTVYGKGTVCAGYLRNTFGLVPEEKKVVITCASTYAKADLVLKLLVEQFHFDKPNTGIAFTVPIDRVSY